jgi:ribosomal protein L4
MSEKKQQAPNERYTVYINVYDILRRKKLVLTKAAVEALEARFK